MRILLKLTLITLILSNACTHYLDKNYRFTGKDYEFISLKDKNIFSCTSNLILTRDTEKIPSTKFKLYLPKNIKTFNVGDMNEFIFYYPNKQYFIIHMDNERKHIVSNDTLYTPNYKELEPFIEKLGTPIVKELGTHKRERRVRLIFKRRNASILLYNIKKENIGIFIKCAESLEFL